MRELRNSVNYFRFPAHLSLIIISYMLAWIFPLFPVYGKQLFSGREKNLQGNHSLLVCFSYFSSQPSSFNIWCVQVQFKAVSEHSNRCYIHHLRVLMRFNISNGYELNFTPSSGHSSTWRRRNLHFPIKLLLIDIFHWRQFRSTRRKIDGKSRPQLLHPRRSTDTRKTKSQLMEARKKYQFIAN